MSDLSIFKFENCELRTVVVDGEPFFVGKDVAFALGYIDPTTAIRSHCRGAQRLHPVVDSLGRTQEARIISEPDLMRLVVGSTLPAAQKFEQLVFEEILPTIRKTGSYSVKKNQNLLMLTESMAVAHERNMLTKQDASNILSAAALSLFPGADVILNSLISESEKKEVSSYEKSWIKFKKKRSVSVPSGHKNISWIKSREKWKAHVRENGQRVYIGLFLTIEEAVAAVEARKAKQAI